MLKRPPPPRLCRITQSLVLGIALSLALVPNAWSSEFNSLNQESGGYFWFVSCSFANNQKECDCTVNTSAIRQQKEHAISTKGSVTLKQKGSLYENKKTNEGVYLYNYYCWYSQEVHSYNSCSPVDFYNYVYFNFILPKCATLLPSINLSFSPNSNKTIIYGKTSGQIIVSVSISEGGSQGFKNLKVSGAANNGTTFSNNDSQVAVATFTPYVL